MQCECGECGWEGFDNGDGDCPSCGAFVTEVGSTTMPCPSCGFMIEDFDIGASSSVCTSCGTDF